MTKVLIVEDEPELASILREYLEKNQYQVEILDDGLGAAQRILQGDVDLVLLDLMLPHKDGLTVCTEVRQDSQVPIIMMTAKVEEVDRLLGLKLGADDYICKPYSPREVVARVEAVLRRVRRSAEPAVAEDRLDLDAQSLEARYRDKTVELTFVEFNILSTLVSKPHCIFTRNQLMDHAYKDERIVNDRTIDSHITKLRKKLKNNLGADVIRSVYGVGYKLELP